MLKPPILNFAVPQRKDVGVMYKYDNDLNLNIVSTAQGMIKFIDLADSSIEFSTKTEVQRERDDDTIEFATKTAVQREGDDDNPYSLMEFSTKTRVERESDDNDLAYNLLEFATKTKIERESDDQ